MDEKLDLATAESEDAGSDVAASLDGSEDLQKAVLSLIKKHNSRMRVERRAEVEAARNQRLYVKGEQNLYWDEDRGQIRSGYDDDEDDEPNSRVFNIVQGYMRIFTSTFCQGRPKVRAEADDPFNAQMISATSHAETYRRVYEKVNDISALTMEAARLLWSDGRIVSDTYYDEVKQAEVTDLYGVLESRVMIVARSHKKSPIIQLETDEPICFVKAEFPKADDKISAQAGDSYDRAARLAVMRAKGSDTEYGVASADSDGVATITRSFLRPEAFQDLAEESDRAQMLEMFPDGLLFTHNGDTYLSSEPVKVDDRLDVLLPSPGDGQSRSSVGSPAMPLQDSVNEFSNLIEELFERGLPRQYIGNKLLDGDGIRDQPNLPGDVTEVALEHAADIRTQIFETAALTPSGALVGYVENLSGPMAQFATGQQPALYGAAMEDQKTASGYAQAKNMALGLMALTWKPFLSWYARVVTQAIRFAVDNRQGDIKATLPASKPGGKAEAVQINPRELVGASFTVDGDDNFPVSWSEKRQNYQALVGLAGGNPAIAEMLTHPDNLALGKSLWGLEDFVVPQEDQRDCQLAEISEMQDLAKRKRAAAAALAGAPPPDAPPQPALPAPPPSAMPAPGPAPVPPMMPQGPQSSVPIDADFDDHAVHLEECKRWLYSPAGRQAKIAEPSWFLDVRSHAELHMAAIKAAQPPPPVPTDKPKLAINFKDLPPDGQVQAAGEAGIHIGLPAPPPLPPKPPQAAA